MFQARMVCGNAGHLRIHQSVLLSSAGHLEKPGWCGIHLSETTQDSRDHKLPRVCTMQQEERIINTELG